ncbi:MAG: hypothetical protein J5602_01275 [Clostridia bacterium]|nr:hypothetical protein [Clostridia bacterium]
MGRIKIGWASRDITTDKPIPVNGQAYLRVSEGVMDPLTTTALVVDDGRDCAIFVSIDTGGIRCGLHDEIREKTRALRPEIPVEKIITNATHTHTGASHFYSTFNTWASEAEEDHVPLSDKYEIASSDEYRHWLSGQIAEMVAEAWDKRSEGGVAYGYGYAVVAHSRRVCYFDDVSAREGADKTNTFAVNGHSVMYGNTNDDMFSHYEAGADHFVNLMFTFDAKDRLTGAIVNVPCPSQNSEHEWKLSADYWHDVRVAIRAKYGDIFILPQCAAAGDLSPRLLHYKKAQERRFRLKYGMDAADASHTELNARRDIAERVAAAFDEVYAWARKDIRREMPVSHRVSTIRIARHLVTEEERAAAEEGLAASRRQSFVISDDPKHDFVTNTIIVSNRKRFLTVLRNYEAQKTEKTMPMELHVLRIGDIAFASNRFELYMDYQHRIQSRSPFEQTFIIQLAGQPGEEGGTYLPTERGYWGKGYSAIVYSMTASPEGGQQIVEETVRQLKELSEEGEKHE